MAVLETPRRPQASRNTALARALKASESFALRRDAMERELRDVSRLELWASTPRDSQSDDLRGLEEKILGIIAAAVKADAAALGRPGALGLELVRLTFRPRELKRSLSQRSDAEAATATRAALEVAGDRSLVSAPLGVGDVEVGELAFSRKRPFDDVDAKLVEAGAAMAALSLHNARVFRQLHFENAKTQQELDLASRIQLGLLPKSSPRVPRLRVRSFARAARRVSGDYFGYARGQGGKLSVFVGDVAGKGVPAALVMALANNVFRELAADSPEPDRLMTEANRRLSAYLGTGPTYVTAVHALINAQRMELELAKAGHEKPLIYRARSGRAETLDARGTVLGMFSSAEYESERVKLEAGDVVVLFTDGAVDATSASGEKFGLERLTRLVECHASSGSPAVIEALERALGDFSEGCPLADDVTVVAVEAGHDGWEEVRFESTREQANRVKGQLYDFLEDLPFSKAAFEDLKFSVKEAVNNAIEHGNRGDAAKWVTLSWRLDRGSLRIRVRDEGDGFDPSSVPDPTLPENLYKPRGRGLHLLNKMMESVIFNSIGNQIEICRRVNS